MELAEGSPTLKKMIRESFHEGVEATCNTILEQDVQGGMAANYQDYISRGSKVLLELFEKDLTTCKHYPEIVESLIDETILIQFGLYAKKQENDRCEDIIFLILKHIPSKEIARKIIDHPETLNRPDLMNKALKKQKALFKSQGMDREEETLLRVDKAINQLLLDAPMALIRQNISVEFDRLNRDEKSPLFLAGDYMVKGGERRKLSLLKRDLSMSYNQLAQIASPVERAYGCLSFATLCIRYGVQFGLGAKAIFRDILPLIDDEIDDPAIKRELNDVRLSDIRRKMTDVLCNRVPTFQKFISEDRDELELQEFLAPFQHDAISGKLLLEKVVEKTEQEDLGWDQKNRLKTLFEEVVKMLDYELLIGLSGNGKIRAPDMRAFLETTKQLKLAEFMKQRKK